MVKKKQKENKHFFKKTYIDSWEFIKQNKNYIYFGVIIFALFALISFIFPAPKELSDLIYKFIEEILLEIEDLRPCQLMGFIFWNNIKSAFMIFILGVGFGLFPLSAAITNGYLIGFVARESVAVEGIFVLWRLLPHGIFELPAIFISIGLGLKLGLGILKDRTNFKKTFIQSFKVFVFVVLPLLIIAAIIEGILVYFLG